MVDWVLALLREERALNEAGLGAATAKCTVVRRAVIFRMHGSASHAIVYPEESPLLVTVHTSFAVRKSSPEV